MKKIFTALFAFVATLTASAQAWDGTAAIWTNGDGTEANPYLIETPANLAYLSTSVNATETYEGKFFKVANELNMGADAGRIFVRLESSTMLSIPPLCNKKTILSISRAHLMETISPSEIS